MDNIISISTLDNKKDGKIGVEIGHAWDYVDVSSSKIGIRNYISNNTAIYLGALLNTINNSRAIISIKGDINEYISYEAGLLLGNIKEPATTYIGIKKSMIYIDVD